MALLRVALLALAVVVGGLSAVEAGPVLPCGLASAPTCGGQCPAGQRCIASIDAFNSITITATFECEANAEPLRREAAAANGDCVCAEVSCGGMPLGQDQGCCNGRPFTLGTQGCCNGLIVDAAQPCECDGEAIDLAEAGCCGAGEAEEEFNPAIESCCQQPVSQEGCTGTVATTATFNFGFDCCPSPSPDDSQFCDGQCAGSECLASGCCQCGDCFAGPQCGPGGPTEVENVNIACVVGCFAQVCTEIFVTQVDSGICTEEGACQAAAPIPVASHGSLLFTAGLLAALGTLALARRMRRRADS